MNSGATWEIWAWMAGAAVVNVLWQGGIVGGLGAATLAAMRKATPQTRYGVACATLAMMAALLPFNLIVLDAPPVTLLHKAQSPLPYVLLPVPIQSAEQIDTNSPHTGNLALTAVRETSRGLQVKSDAPPTRSEVSPARQERPRPGKIDWYDRAMPWIGQAWWLGVLTFACYDLLGLWAIKRIRGRSTPAPAPLLHAADHIRMRLGVTTQVSIRIAEGISSALVTGFYRVVILLPASMASGMAPEHVEAILAHEMAHIQRWDRWLNLFQRFIEAALFFHPFIWWISRIARTERELCCDEIALQICPDRPVYVRALLDLSRLGDKPALALSSHGGGLALRVRHILHSGHAARHDGQRARLACCATLAAIPLALTLYAQVGNAAAVPERILHFPSKENVGTVYGRWADVDYRMLPWMPDHNEGWTMLALARGDVKVPKNTLVKLTVSAGDLTFLETLKPDDLYFVDASFKKLSDAELAPIGHLSGLRALDLSDNNDAMSGEALASFNRLTKLEWLDLERSNLNAMPEGTLSHFPKLQYLAGHFHALADSTLRSAADMADLEFLSLKSGTISADALRSINHHPTLRGLALDNVGLSDSMLADLDDLPNLLYLDVRKNPISDTAIAYVNRFPSMRSLNLDRTPITDAGIESLYRNAVLEHIYLSNTNVTEDCLGVLGTMPALSMASLVNTHVDEVTAGVFTTGLLTQSDSAAPPQQSSNPDAPKVGLVFSHATATSPHITSQTSGYTVQDSLELTRALNEANFDVYAVVEPGTEILGELPWLLHSQGLDDKIINGFDPAAMAKLDTLFASTLYAVPVPMLEAIGNAVEQGMGLVNVGALGVATPGELYPAVERLTGLDQSAVYWQEERDSVCPVVKGHPILGTVQPGDAFVLSRLDGCNTDSGILRDGITLIDAPPGYPGVFPVLYTRTLGNGRIVRAQWNRPFHPGIPFPGFSFYVRAINWTAYRDANAIW